MNLRALILSFALYGIAKGDSIRGLKNIHTNADTADVADTETCDPTTVATITQINAIICKGPFLEAINTNYTDVKVNVCHHSGKNGSRSKTLCIGVLSICDHYNQGDNLGVC